jgi:hypothetical protein
MLREREPSLVDASGYGCRAERVESGDSPYWEACPLKRRGAETRAWEVKRPPLSSVATQMEAALSCDRDSFIGLAWGLTRDATVKVRRFEVCRLPSPLVQALCRHNAERVARYFLVSARNLPPSPTAHASFFGPLQPPRHWPTAESLLVRRGVDGDAQAMRHATRRGAGAGVASLLVKLLVPKHDWPVWKTSEG